MYKDTRILGVITARGGSKAIPKKNIKDLLGKPLIAYTIEAALRSSLLTKVIVSTDNEAIAAVAKEYGADVPYMQPDEIAQDHSMAFEAVQYAVQTLKEQGEEFDYAMMLQPTSPMRTAEDIDACITLAVDKDADSVMSMKQLTDFSTKKLKSIDENGQIHGLLEEEGKQTAARTEASPVFKRNCAVYLTKTDLITAGDQFGKKSLAYLMSEERSIDINEPIDFSIAGFLMSQT